ncbi:PTS sugar transporter subunit IIB [Bacillus sp. BRMEA1]|uniref:PTS sugar transporter subunit IIB n=1 Tax=Neobacillus endophyticus TaxID=2738405 RepID=UPI00156699C6|nr:PTS sugar transporter subunit IIB [Neobacillus endophyticus]NRD76313.1 PTS sugar transporter subunit IIB [Neobacillus endophyticus]
MNILLCCSAGMSTSLLVSKMQKSALEQNLSCQIWAVPIDVVIREINKADVLLLGPHVRYMFNEFKKLGDKKGIPVAVIDTVHYGTFNGKEVLRTAERLYKEMKGSANC